MLGFFIKAGTLEDQNRHWRDQYTLGMKLRSLGVILLGLLLGVLATGCESLGRTPSAKITGYKLDGLSLDGVTLAFDVKVSNPTKQPLAISELEYALTNKEVEGEPFVQGSQGVNDVIGASSSRTIKVPAVLSFAQLLEAMDQGEPGSVIAYAADLALVTDHRTPEAEALKLPMKWEGKFPIPAMPEVEMIEAGWTDIGMLSAKGRIVLRVKNTNQFDVEVKKLGYKMQLQGATLASGGLSRSRRLKPGETQEIEIPFKVSALKVGAAVMDATRKNQAGFRVAGDLNLKTEFGSLDLPFERVGN